MEAPFYSPIPPLDTYTWIGAASWSEHGWVIGGAALRILVAGEGDLTPVELDLPRGGTPSLVRLDAPWPNPFNPSTTLRYHLAADGPVLVTVHDVAGRLVRTLVRGVREAGAHSVTWHGTADTGHPVPAGDHLVRVVSRGEHDVVKAVLVE